MHPDGGRPINPYPILEVASRRYQAGIDRERFEVATVVGFDGTQLLPNGSTIGQVQRTHQGAAANEAAGEAVGGESLSSEPVTDPARVAGAIPAQDLGKPG
jgi:hypothetical protein